MITYFNSKKYIRFSLLQTFRFDTLENYPLLDEQKNELLQTFSSQSVRYEVVVKDTWLEETFDSMDGTTFTVYTDLHSDDMIVFMQEVVSYFGYLLADQFPTTENEETIRSELYRCFNASPFFVEQEALFYEDEEGLLYLMIDIQEDGTFFMKAMETERSNGLEKNKRKLGIITNLLKERFVDFCQNLD